MKYRVRIDLSFDIVDKSQADKLKDAIQPFIQYAKNINPGANNQEIGFIDIEQDFHDETPPKPCITLARWEVDKGKII